MSDEIARYNNRMYARELRRKKREKDTLAFFSDEELMCAYANAFSAGADEEYENQEIKEVIRGIIKNDLSEMQRKAIIYVFYTKDSKRYKMRKIEKSLFYVVCRYSFKR